jgi:CheY-like chemotaxis protein
MDATYCILWLDDQKDELKGVVKNLESRLASVGLNIHITWQESFDDESMKPILTSLRKHSPYDLIMVDYDLGVGRIGHRITKQIRSHTYGDMVFYSSAPDEELRRQLFDEKVDGVYCMQRASLAQEVFSLAQNAIRRVIHPNYMRGLVVGSVGELEGLFEDTINAIINKKGSPSDEEVRVMARDSLLEYIKDLTDEKLPRLETMPVDRIVKKMNLRVKVDLLLRLLDEDGNQLSLTCHHVISRFADEINQHRIEFAHARTTNLSGIPVFQDRNKKVWGPEEMRTLLLKLREHYDAARHISDYFNAG